jgi:protein SMG7
MQTSYAFISIYKQRIASLDRALQSAPRHQPRQGGHGPVEYRKLMQRFRQFLAEEEKFWTQLVVRLRRSFGLDEAQSAFVTLGILPSAEATSAQEGVEPAHHKEVPTTNGRNQFQFPPEDSSPSALPHSSAERVSRLAILSKAMVCLGDIARYRELYNESGGRPKAGHEESPLPARKNVRNKRGGAPGMEVIPRARNYDKAQQCYEQARLLVPYEGNPSHQLAILASYQKDLFGSLIHYYRALCVLQPYETASENLGTVVNKALDQWKARTKREKEKNGGKVGDGNGSAPLAPRLRVEIFKEKVVVLHALWRLGIDRYIFLFIALTTRLLIYYS